MLKNQVASFLKQNHVNAQREYLRKVILCSWLKSPQMSTINQQINSVDSDMIKREFKGEYFEFKYTTDLQLNYNEKKHIWEQFMPNPIDIQAYEGQLNQIIDAELIQFNDFLIFFTGVIMLGLKKAIKDKFSGPEDMILCLPLGYIYLKKPTEKKEPFKLKCGIFKMENRGKPNLTADLLKDVNECYNRAELESAVDNDDTEYFKCKPV